MIPTGCRADRGTAGGSAPPALHSLSALCLSSSWAPGSPGTLQNKGGAHRVLHPEPSALQVHQCCSRAVFRGQFQLRVVCSCCGCTAQLCLLSHSGSSLGQWKMLENFATTSAGAVGIWSPPCLGHRGSSDVWLPLLSPVVRICRGVTSLPFFAGTQHSCPALPVHDATPEGVPAPLGRDCPMPGWLQRLRDVMVPQEQHPRFCHRAGWAGAVQHTPWIRAGESRGVGPTPHLGLCIPGMPLTPHIPHTPKSWQASAPPCCILSMPAFPLPLRVDGSSGSQK